MLLPWLTFLRSASSRAPIAGLRRTAPPLRLESLEERALLSASLSIQDSAWGEGLVTDWRQVAVTLSAPTDQTVTVHYATAHGSAKGGDYVSTSGTLTFAPGESVQYIYVTIKGDKQVENDEWFAINLSQAVNAVISDAQAIVSLWNDDYPVDRCKPHDDPRLC